MSRGGDVGAAATRVVSLVPSATESLLAWGVVPVACTRFCEQPDLRAVGGTKDPDVEAIVALGPDLVVVNDEENRREDAAALVDAGISIHSCSPRHVDDVASAMAALADAVGLGGSTPTPGTDREGGSAMVDGEALELLEPLGLRAFVPIWRRPWMAIGGDTYGASLLASIGVASVTDEMGEGRYPTVELEAVSALRPDVVLAPSEPYAFRPKHLEELAAVAPVVPVDGQDLFWWGHRTPAARRRLHAHLTAARP